MAETAKTRETKAKDPGPGTTTEVVKEAPVTTTDAGPLPVVGDRVAMLSLKADGSVNQTAPEFIIPEEDATSATTTQYVETATGAVDQARAIAENVAAAAPVEVPEDPATTARRRELDKTADQARGHAESLVKNLQP